MNLPEWGELKVKDNIIYYVHAKLDEELNPQISAEDLRAVSDYPAVYIYVSEKKDGENSFFYIGQTINISNRTGQHKNKGDSNERFKKFINGDYYVFYSEDIENNINYIEMLLIRMFYREFNIFNFIDLNKDGAYINSTLANKTFGNDSGKYKEKRIISTELVNKILEKLREDKIIVNNYDLKNNSYLFSSSPFFDLTKNQEDILRKIIERDKSEDKKVSIYKG